MIWAQIVLTFFVAALLGQFVVPLLFASDDFLYR